MVLTDKELKEIAQFSFKQMKHLLKGQICSIRFETDVNKNGDTIYLIQVIDESPLPSLTTITCHSEGYNFHWGSSTPRFLRAEMEKIMDGA
ncbi:hypothetical protein [Priestia megaterium]|uniref:hypothetical protein n=1 Tax=Priestia megaterium TaxID=1404 RepID=UPI003C2ADE02